VWELVLAAWLADKAVQRAAAKTVPALEWRDEWQPSPPFDRRLTAV
jgi:hypothetical protein